MLSWSPDGRRLIYSGCAPSCNTVIVNDDGTWPFVLLPSAQNAFAAWSPDGQKVAYMGVGGTDLELFIADVDGGNARQLTYTPGVSEAMPSWSPDGNRLTFAAATSDGNWDVYTINADGTDLQRLTSSPGADYTPPVVAQRRPDPLLLRPRWRLGNLRDEHRRQGRPSIDRQRVR
jgi:Tol biopolymer transport system component